MWFHWSANKYKHLFCFDALWASYVSPRSYPAPSTARYPDSCDVMKCDTSCLVVILIIYIHLCWMWKLGCCALLCNKFFILSVSKWMLWKWSNILCEYGSSRWAVSIIYCLTALRSLFYNSGCYMSAWVVVPTRLFIFIVVICLLVCTFSKISHKPVDKIKWNSQKVNIGCSPITD